MVISHMDTVDNQTFINPFKLNELSYLYRYDQSIQIFRGVGWYFSFLFKKF